MLRTTGWAASAALVAALGLAGCATPGEPVSPRPLVQASDLGLAPDVATPAVEARWWRLLGDPALDDLVQRALDGQPTLRVAAARLARAEAAVAASAATDGPQASLSADATRQHFTSTGLYPPPLAGSMRNTSTLQAGASLSLDFFGRHAAALQAALGQQRAAEADLQAARLLLTSQVTRVHVGLARTFALREVAERTLAQREQWLALTAQRVKAGLDPLSERRTLEGTVAEARQQIAALDEQIALARTQLAQLSGQAPDALAHWRPALTGLQVAPLPAALGADLLGRRPEIAAARWRVEAAVQEVAQAEAQFYPDINLVGFVGLSAIGLDRLVQLPSRQFGVGPALRLPLFDSGLLRARVRGQAAELDAAVAVYHGAVLDAVREATDAIAVLQAVHHQQAEQSQALAAAQAAHALVRSRRESGLTSELSVLAAESAVLAQRRAAAELRGRELDGQVVLMRALGGGWRAGTAPVQETRATQP